MLKKGWTNRSSVCELVLEDKKTIKKDHRKTPKE